MIDLTTEQITPLERGLESAGELPPTSRRVANSAVIEGSLTAHQTATQILGFRSNGLDDGVINDAQRRLATAVDTLNSSINDSVRDDNLWAVAQGDSDAVRPLDFSRALDEGGPLHVEDKGETGKVTLEKNRIELMASTPPLERDLQELTQKKLQFTQEISGFLAREHPLCAYLQKTLDTMKDPSAPGTRILIAVNETHANAFVLPDGTIVINQSLINRMDKMEEVIAILAHEQVHFEKKHYQKKLKDWNPHSRGSVDDQLKGWIREVGLGRMHEYQADLLLTSKLDALGIDTMIFKEAIRKVGGKGGDTVHGTNLDRALNVVQMHAVADFESSDSDPSSLHDIPKAWKLKVEQSNNKKLSSLKPNDEWRSVLNNAGPVLFRVYSRELVQRARGSFGTTGRNKRRVMPEFLDEALGRQENLQKVRHLQQLVKERLSHSSLNPEEQRLAFILFFTDGLGFHLSDWKIIESSKLLPRSKSLKTEVDITELTQPSDFSLTTFAKVSDLHRTGDIYHIVGIDEPVSRGVASLYGSGMYDFVHDINITMKSGSEVRSGEVSLDSFVRYLVRMRDGITKQYGNEEISQEWFVLQLGRGLDNYMSSQTKPLGIGRQKAVQEVTKKLSDISRVYDIDFKYSHLKRLAGCASEGMRGTGKRKQKVEEVAFQQFVQELRQSDASFLAAIESENVIYLQEFAQHPAEFLRQIALISSRGENHQKVVDLVTGIMINNSELRNSKREHDLSKTQRERLVALGLDAVDQLGDQESITTFSSIQYAIEAICVITAGLDLSTRNTTLKRYLDDSNVQSRLRSLSVTHLDSICTMLSNEGSLVVMISMGGGMAVEKKHDVPRPSFPRPDFINERLFFTDTSDQVLSLSPYSILRDKLLENVPEGDLKQSKRILEYYSALIAEMYFFNKRSIWGTTLKSGEAISPLSLHFLSQIERTAIDSVADPNGLIEVYDSIQQYLPRNTKVNNVSMALAERIVENLPFNEALMFLSVEARKGTIDFRVVTNFVEDKLRTREQFYECRGAIAQAVDTLISNPPKAVGGLVLADRIGEAGSGYLEMDKLLADMMSLHADDEGLRNHLGAIWWDVVVNPTIHNSMIIGYDFATTKDDVMIVGPNPGNFISFEDTMDQMFSLSDLQKQVLLRKILLSAGGILPNTKYHRSLVDKFMERMQSDTTLTPLIENVSVAALASCDPLLIFTPLADAISPVLLNRPISTGHNEQAVKSLARHRVSNLRASGYHKKYDWNDRTLRKLLSLSEERVSETTLRQQPATRQVYEQYQSLVDNLIAHFEVPPEEGVSREALQARQENSSPIEVILKVAGSMGPVGVRFMQVLGQYVDIDPKYDDRFRNVYDSMPGQSKYTAFTTLERLGKTDEAVQTFLKNELVSIDEKIGGGSIFTAYKTTVRRSDGQLATEVLKIKNPNAERWVNEIVVEAQKVLKDLQTRDKKNKAKYEVAASLLDTIQQWVLDDIADPNFMAEDGQFRRSHQGFEASNGARIHIAGSKEPNNRWIKREEYVEGQTFNQLARQTESSEVRHTMRVVALAEAEHLRQQLTIPVLIKGEKIYLIHSDIHPGNIIVNQTEDGTTVNPIDRNYYLKLTQKDADFIRFLVAENESKVKLEGIVDYFIDLPENADLHLDSKQVADQIYSSIFRAAAMRKLRGKADMPPIQLMNKVLQGLDVRGVEVPLRMRIMMKNLNAVERMLKDTDNGNLGDVLL